MPVIPALARLKQDSEFEVWTVYRDPDSENKIKKNNEFIT
jgi:hypothetical protein